MSEHAGHEWGAALQRYALCLQLSRNALANFHATHCEPEDLDRLFEATALVDELASSVARCRQGTLEFELLEPLWADVYDAIASLELGVGLTGELHPDAALLDRILEETCAPADIDTEFAAENTEEPDGDKAGPLASRWLATESKGNMELGDIILIREGDFIDLAAGLGVARRGGADVRLELIRDGEAAEWLRRARAQEAAAQAEEADKRQAVKERLAARMAATAKRRATGL
mmetsp:Transcript_94404/g.294040  ORF Transcript_94404/g.294040 Transcript_94404/m.294040 type:complete len:232 (-) Transcript_94404:74-769(-)